jgi:hypothetical protein
MAQKPVIPKSRKTVERTKKQAANGSVKEVKRAVGARGSTLVNIDSLVSRKRCPVREMPAKQWTTRLAVVDPNVRSFAAQPAEIYFGGSPEACEATHFQALSRRMKVSENLKR